MSYIHKGWVIDGKTDWLVHAFKKGVSEHSFTVNNNWTKPNIEPLCHLDLFPWVACRETESQRKIWHSFIFFDECLERLSFHPPTTLPSPSPRIDLSPGTPEAIRRCWLVSLSLVWSVLSILVNSNTSHTLSCSPTPHCHPSSTLFPLSLCNHSGW